MFYKRANCMIRIFMLQSRIPVHRYTVVQLRFGKKNSRIIRENWATEKTAGACTVVQSILHAHARIKYVVIVSHA